MLDYVNSTLYQPSVTNIHHSYIYITYCQVHWIYTSPPSMSANPIAAKKDRGLSASVVLVPIEPASSLQPEPEDLREVIVRSDWGTNWCGKNDVKIWAGKKYGFKYGLHQLVPKIVPNFKTPQLFQVPKTAKRIPRPTNWWSGCAGFGGVELVFHQFSSVDHAMPCLVDHATGPGHAERRPW